MIRTILHSLLVLCATVLAAGCMRKSSGAADKQFRADSLRLTRAMDSVYEVQFEHSDAAWSAWQDLAEEARRLHLGRPLFNYYKYATANRLLFAADVPTAAGIAQQAMQDARLSGDSQQLGIANFCYGMLYGYREISDTSSLYFIRAAEYLKGGKDWGTLLDAWNNLAEMSRLEGDYENAEKYILEAHGSTVMRNEPRQMAHEFALLFEVNNAMNRNREAKRYLDSATFYFTKTHDLDNPQYSNIRGHYFLKHDITDSAIVWFRKAGAVLRERGDSLQSAIAMLSLAESFASRQQTDSVYHALLLTAQLTDAAALPVTSRKTYYSLKLALPDRYLSAAERTALSAASIDLLQQLLANNQKLAGTQYMHTMEQAKKDNIILSKTLQSTQRGQWIGLLAASLVVLAVVTAAVVYSYRKRRELESGRLKISKQERALEILSTRMNTQQEERNRISHELHDDLGATLTSIAMATELLKRRHPLESSREVAIIAEGSAGLVDKMNEIVWSLNANNDTVQSLVAYTRRFASGFLDEAGIALQLEVPAQVPETVLQSAVRRAVFLTVKEALNNIVKHSGATKVVLGLRLEGQVLSISVADNGAGFRAANNDSTGNGLLNMRSNIAAIGGTIGWKDTGHGTLVTLTAPIDHAV